MINKSSKCFIIVTPSKALYMYPLDLVDKEYYKLTGNSSILSSYESMDDIYEWVLSNIEFEDIEKYSCLIGSADKSSSEVSLTIQKDEYYRSVLLLASVSRSNNPKLKGDVFHETKKIKI